MGKSLYPPGALFCRACGYCLHGLPANRCPECGRDFDPADPRTFRRAPQRLWVGRLLKWGGAAMLLLALAYGSFLGWLYLGYRAEAGARALKMGSDVVVETRPILSAKLAWLLPPPCRPWQERAHRLVMWGRPLTPQEIAAISACRRLRVLRLSEVPLKAEDVALICQCPELEELFLFNNGLRGKDASGLSALKRLRVLDLSGNRRLDDSAVTAAGQLNELKVLCLPTTIIADGCLAHLAGLTNLETLNLRFCRNLTDGAVPHLSRLQGLKELWLNGTPLTPAAFDQLKKNLPQCQVEGP